MTRTIILYHSSCPDGFGGAYAAWKKFGDSVEYQPLSHGTHVLDDYAGAEVYMIDLCFPQEEMEELARIAKRLVVLDHHKGVEDIVRSMPEYVYDPTRSGASIAWTYFHPDTPLPKLLAHVEDDDLYLFKLPDTRPVLTYISARPFDFEAWDEIVALLSDERAEALLTTARAYAEYFELLARISVQRAKRVTFEGYECLFAATHPIKPMKSLVGNLLTQELPPIGLVVTAHPEGYGVSIRSDGSVDVSKIAQKYGGNGHPASSGFLIPREGPFPWEIIEDSSDD